MIDISICKSYITVRDVMERHEKPLNEAVKNNSLTCAKTQNDTVWCIGGSMGNLYCFLNDLNNICDFMVR